MKILKKLKTKISFRTTNKEITHDEAMNLINNNENIVLIDVRSKQEYEEGHLKGAISIPVYDIAQNISKHVNNRNNIIILYCQTGARSKKAAKILSNLCFEKIYIIKGGIEN